MPHSWVRPHLFWERSPRTTTLPGGSIVIQSAEKRGVVRVRGSKKLEFPCLCTGTAAHWKRVGQCGTPKTFMPIYGTASRNTFLKSHLPAQTALKFSGLWQTSRFAADREQNVSRLFLLLARHFTEFFNDNFNSRSAPGFYCHCTITKSVRRASGLTGNILVFLFPQHRLRMDLNIKFSATLMSVIRDLSVLYQNELQSVEVGRSCELLRKVAQKCFEPLYR